MMSPDSWSWTACATSVSNSRGASCALAGAPMRSREDRSSKTTRFTLPDAGCGAKTKGSAAAAALPSRTRTRPRLEVVLQHELDHPAASLQVDLAEVVLGRLRVLEPGGRIADVVRGAAGAIRH